MWALLGALLPELIRCASFEEQNFWAPGIQALQVGSALIAPYTRWGKLRESRLVYDIWQCLAGSSCEILASLYWGMPFIRVAVKLRLLYDIHVQNSVVRFHKECGSMEEAELAFNRHE
ncbi:hypothetical protein NE237_029576 [Protea cynaroides]|uniref:Uncharacterized protein n=1 Tax=Protea cynaroides TaxID=273540 RepID=A0A9Q0JU15_9MAGN|nr:hypothetical protein NE237_029576 [Protea cynaroides]